MVKTSRWENCTGKKNTVTKKGAYVYKCTHNSDILICSGGLSKHDETHPAIVNYILASKEKFWCVFHTVSLLLFDFYHFRAFLIFWQWYNHRSSTENLFLRQPFISNKLCVTITLVMLFASSVFILMYNFWPSNHFLYVT